MPIFEISCQDCGRIGEVLTLENDADLVCPSCGSTRTAKLMSATSPLSGKHPNAYPGPGDTACCGSAPNPAGCAGPGSCCGKTG